MKLKNYSSGMYVRLAFAVMIHVDAEVLLIDEVLAVGDAAFQHKCYREFDRMREEGRTILFVTHDMSAVNRFCHRALLLERGRMVSMGIPHEVSGEYLAVNFRHERKVDATEATGQLRDRAAFIAEAWFEDERGERVEFLTQGQSCVCRVRVEINWELQDPTFVLAIESERRRARVRDLERLDWARRRAPSAPASRSSSRSRSTTRSRPGATTSLPRSRS